MGMIKSSRHYQEKLPWRKVTMSWEGDDHLVISGELARNGVWPHIPRHINLNRMYRFGAYRMMVVSHNPEYDFYTTYRDRGLFSRFMVWIAEKIGYVEETK